MPTDVLVESVRERSRSLLWWGLGIVGLVGVTVAFYPSIRDDAGLSSFGEDLPESLRALFVGGELDLASPVGYLNSQIYAALAPLLFLVFSIGGGAGAVAGEEERGTLDLLLAQPVRRRDYVVQRFLALATLVAALTAVLLATVALGSALVDLEIGFDKLLAASVSVALLAVLFGAVALAVGAIRPGRAGAIAVAAGADGRCLAPRRPRRRRSTRSTRCVRSRRSTRRSDAIRCATACPGRGGSFSLS